MSYRFVGLQLREDIINEGSPVAMIIIDNPTDQDFKNNDYDDYHWCNNNNNRYRRSIDYRNKQFRSYRSQRAGE